jgi:ATP-dependent DNA helicase RecG
MSATPIPRTLTLTKYGELDVSRLDEMPAGRKKIGTFRVDSTYRERLYSFIEKQAKEGHRTYVVCPAIEESEPQDTDSMANLFFGGMFEEQLPILAATKCAEEISEALPALRVGCVHGKMKSADKDAVMNAFTSGGLDVLVATTVIEVGINVPEATLMVVWNAERFGLAQLHQLRGRVGRSDEKSWCILVSDSKTESANARLDTMVNCSDGFEIAEADLRQRGPGDFFGSGELRQSGNYVPPLAASCSDEQLLAAAADAAAETVSTDPTLSLPENALAGAMTERFISNIGSTVN